MADLFQSHSRSARLDQVLRDLLGRAPELQAASVVSFDGLPMASALPSGMDEDRVAAMSAALLSLGERAAENFGRGSLNQVYVEGENGTVFLVSADDEAVLVAVGAKGAKVGLLMFEVRRSAVSVAEALRADDAAEAARADVAPEPEWPEPVLEPVVEAVRGVRDGPGLRPRAGPGVAEVPRWPSSRSCRCAPSRSRSQVVPALHVVEGGPRRAGRDRAGPGRGRPRPTSRSPTHSRTPRSCRRRCRRRGARRSRRSASPSRRAATPTTGPRTTRPNATVAGPD